MRINIARLVGHAPSRPSPCSVADVSRPYRTVVDRRWAQWAVGPDELMQLPWKRSYPISDRVCRERGNRL